MANPSQRGMTALGLSLAESSPAPEILTSALARANAAGIRFFTLDAAGDTLDHRRKVFELVREGVVDDPSNDGTFMDFEEFSEHLFGAYYWRWSDAQFLAAAGDEWVGLTNLQLREATRAEFGVTVVRRGYRRRGIARALKLLALDYLRRRGVRSVHTRNDPTNTPILCLNRDLGFRQT